MVHLLRIEEVCHLDKFGQVKWQSTNLLNTLHTQGEEFILKVMFSSAVEKPEYYYFGLDNRSSISVSDELVDLVDEPSGNGYSRQAKNSTTDWSFTTQNGYWAAKSNVITFTATSGIGWGPVRNLFLTMQPASAEAAEGYLISSIYLGQILTIEAGESVSLRMLAGLKWCPGLT